MDDYEIVRIEDTIKFLKGLINYYELENEQGKHNLNWQEGICDANMKIISLEIKLSEIRRNENNNKIKVTK